MSNFPSVLTSKPRPSGLSYGIGGIDFFAPDSLEQEQIGYGGPDWQESWLVVARESACGDPIFVDRSHASLPVFTAMHGMGFWKATPIAESWDKFIAAVELIRPYSKGREHPVGLEENPLSLADRHKLQGGLQEIIGSPIPHFWDLLLQAAEP